MGGAGRPQLRFRHALFPEPVGDLVPALETDDVVISRGVNGVDDDRSEEAFLQLAELLDCQIDRVAAGCSRASWQGRWCAPSSSGWSFRRYGCRPRRRSGCRHRSRRRQSANRRAGPDISTPSRRSRSRRTGCRRCRRHRKTVVSRTRSGSVIFLLQRRQGDVREMRRDRAGESVFEDALAPAVRLSSSRASSRGRPISSAKRRRPVADQHDVRKLAHDLAGEFGHGDRLRDRADGADLAAWCRS